MEVMPTPQNLPINYMNILTALKTKTLGILLQEDGRRLESPQREEMILLR